MGGAASMSTELFEALVAAVPEGSTISTLSRDAPNVVVEITPDHVLIETEHSRQTGDGPQPVAGWMLQRAWDRLRDQRHLTNRELVSTDDLNIKRSSAV